MTCGTSGSGTKPFQCILLLTARCGRDITVTIDSDASAVCKWTAATSRREAMSIQYEFDMQDRSWKNMNSATHGPGLAVSEDVP